MNRRRPGRLFVLIAFILLVGGAIPVFSQAPRLGTPTGPQQEMNRLPALLVGGNNIKYEFGGDTWIAKVDGKNFIAGTVTAREAAGVTTLLLTQTHVYLNANWVQSVGPERVLEYRAGQPLRLLPRSGWDASEPERPAVIAAVPDSPPAQTAPAAAPASPPPAATPQPAPAPAPGSLAAGAAAADAAQTAMEAAFEGNPDATMTVQRSPQRYEDESAAEPQSAPAQPYSPAPEQAATAPKKPVCFSFGLNATLAGYIYQSMYYYDYYYYYDIHNYYEGESENSYTDSRFLPQLSGYLDLEFFSYVKLGVSFVMNHDFDANFTYLGLNPYFIFQIPFKLNQKISLIPQAGLEYYMGLYAGIPGNYSHNRDFLSNADELWLNFGAKLEYMISERWIFKPELLYYIFLYSPGINSESNAKRSQDGPWFILGMEYSITEHVKFNFSVEYVLSFYKYSYDGDYYDSTSGYTYRNSEHKYTNHNLDLNLGIKFVF